MATAGERRSKKESVRAAFACQPTHRVLKALWRHFPTIDQDPALLAEAEVAFAKKYDVDLVKLNPAGTYTIQDRGGEIQFFEDGLTVPKVVRPAVQCASDWNAIRPADVTRGAYGARLECIARCMTEFSKMNLPVYETVFSPLTTVKKLSADERFPQYLREHKTLIRSALRALTEETLAYVMKLQSLGVGVFFATQCAVRHIISEDEYEEFGVPYDLEVLEFAKNGGMSILLHIHGENVMFDLLLKYPADAVSWHTRLTRPSLSEARLKTDKCFLAGVRRETILTGTPADVEAEVLDAVRQVNGRGIIVAPGCTVSPRAPEANLAAYCAAAEKASAMLLQQPSNCP